MLSSGSEQKSYSDPFGIFRDRKESFIPIPEQGILIVYAFFCLLERFVAEGLLQPHAAPVSAAASAPASASTPASAPAQPSTFESFEEIVAALSREFTVGADSIFGRHPGKRDEAFQLINYIDHFSKLNGPSFVNLIPPDEFARVAAWARQILSD